MFALTLNPNGTWTFQLFDQMDHDPPYDVNPPGFENGDDPNFPGNTHNPDADQNTDLIDNDDPTAIRAISTSARSISATSFRRPISTAIRSRSITYSRSPSATNSDHRHPFNDGRNVMVDESAGQQNDDTTDSNVIAVFAGSDVMNKGTDPDVTTQYARSSTNVVSADITIGADEGGSAHWSLVLGNNNNSGLQTTDGHEIFLFQEGNLIVGRYDGSDAGTGVGGGDPAAFAIAINDLGRISIAQFSRCAIPIPAVSTKTCSSVRARYLPRSLSPISITTLRPTKLTSADALASATTVPIRTSI